MNKKLLFLILLIAILVPITILAQAPAAPKTLLQIVDAAAASLKGIGAGLATISFIVAGIMFLSATGNPARLGLAKTALIAAVAGIVIIVLAGGAELFVKTFFGL